MKTVEIHQVLGVSPSTFHDWKKSDHEKNALAMLLSEIPAGVAMTLIENSKKKAASKPIMLMSTINCSIGNKQKHLKLGQVKKLLVGKEPESPVEKYALKIIKTEADKAEIEQFAKYYKLSLGKVEKTVYGQ